MEHELHWNQASLTGAYSLALLVSGLMAVPIGRWLDRVRTPRALMAAGSLLGAVALVVWATSRRSQSSMRSGSRSASRWPPPSTNQPSPPSPPGFRDASGRSPCSPHSADSPASSIFPSRRCWWNNGLADGAAGAGGDPAAGRGAAPCHLLRPYPAVPHVASNERMRQEIALARVALLAAGRRVLWRSSRSPPWSSISSRIWANRGYRRLRRRRPAG